MGVFSVLQLLRESCCHRPTFADVGLPSLLQHVVATVRFQDQGQSRCEPILWKSGGVTLRRVLPSCSAWFYFLALRNWGAFSSSRVCCQLNFLLRERGHLLGSLSRRVARASLEWRLSAQICPLKLTHERWDVDRGGRPPLAAPQGVGKRPCIFQRTDLLPRAPLCRWVPEARHWPRGLRR